MSLNFNEWLQTMGMVQSGLGTLSAQQAAMAKAKADAQRYQMGLYKWDRERGETERHNRTTEGISQGHLDIAREKQGQAVEPSVGRLLKGYAPQVAGPAQAYLLRQHAGQPEAQREAVFGRGRETLGPGGPATLPPIGAQLARRQAAHEQQVSDAKVREKGRITGAQESVKFGFKQKFARGKRTGYEQHLDPTRQLSPSELKENVPYTPSASIKDPGQLGEESQARGATATQRAIQANVRRRGGYTDITEVTQYIESMKREGRGGTAETVIPQALREMGVSDPQILSDVAGKIAEQDPLRRPAEWWQMTISGSF